MCIERERERERGEGGREGEREMEGGGEGGLYRKGERERDYNYRRQGYHRQTIPLQVSSNPQGQPQCL